MADATSVAPNADQTQTTAGDAPDLGKLKKMLDDYRTLFQEPRRQSEIDRDYYDNEQLTPDERAILRSRKQPEIIVNRVAPAVNGILGVAVQGKTDPRALMRNPPKDQPQQPQQAPQPGPIGGAAQAPMAMAQPSLDAGDVATMALRYVADVNHFQATKIDVLENMGIEGSGAVVIEVDQSKEVTISQVRWEEHFYDPRSRKHDFSDARYQGIAKWMYADDVSAMYPSNKQQIEDAIASGDATGQTAFDESWRDRPDTTTQKPAWIDTRQRRIMVVDIYYRDGGQWNRCVFHAGGILLSGPSPYTDDKGRTLCAIEAQSAFVNRKNWRYGMVRAMRGPQDEINMRRIKAVHEINTRQVQQKDPNAPPIDADTVRQEAARPDGVLPAGWEVVPRQDVVANNLNLLQEAKSEIERMGPNPAILGRQGADASGRAQQIRQQSGLIELARFLGRYTDWEMRVYRQAWARARQFWDAPKWIRVTDDDGAPQYVMVNEPAEIDPMTGQPGQPKNHIAEMDVDIIVDSVPDTATLQQEIFNELTQLAQAYGPQAVPFEVLIEMSPLPKKRELLDKLEKARAQAAQANAAGAQLEMADKQVQMEVAKSNAARNNAQAGLAEVNTVVAALEGHLKATTAAQLPPGVTLDGSGAPIPMQPPPPGVPGVNAGPPPVQ